MDPPPMCWDYSHAPPCLVYVVSEVNCMASEMLVKHSTNRAGSQFPGVLKQTNHTSFQSSRTIALLCLWEESRRHPKHHSHNYHILYYTLIDHKKQC